MNDQLTGLVRMFLVFLGSWIVQSGWIDAAMWDTVVGSLVALIGVAWSIYNKVGTTRVPVETLTQKQTIITGVSPKV